MFVADKPDTEAVEAAVEAVAPAFEARAELTTTGGGLASVLRVTVVTARPTVPVEDVQAVCGAVVGAVPAEWPGLFGVTFKDGDPSATQPLASWSIIEGVEQGDPLAEVLATQWSILGPSDAVRTACATG